MSIKSNQLLDEELKTATIPIGKHVGANYHHLTSKYLIGVLRELKNISIGESESIKTYCNRVLTTRGYTFQDIENAFNVVEKPPESSMKKEEAMKKRVSIGFKRF